MNAAERQRRHRHHRKGDHSLCDPARRCGYEDVTRNGVTVDSSAPPPGLADRGRRLWRTLLATQTPGPAALVLIEEACRLADRLDHLHALLTGQRGAWLRFEPDPDSPDEVTVVVDKVLAEARLHATTLRAVVAELRQAGVVGAADAAGTSTSRGGSTLDELERKREERRADSPG